MADKRTHIVWFVTACMLVQSVSMAAGIPAGWGSHNSGVSTFTNVSGGAPVADVTWHVYSDYGGGSGLEGSYVYAYQISNTSAAGLSFFSVQIPASTAVGARDYDNTIGDIEPDIWDVVGSDPQSVEGMFMQTIGCGQSSYLLWFACDTSDDWAKGALVGMSGGYVFATGDIMAPVPEPATIALLAIGGMLVLLRKRK